MPQMFAIIILCCVLLARAVCKWQGRGRWGCTLGRGQPILLWTHVWTHRYIRCLHPHHIHHPIPPGGRRSIYWRVAGTLQLRHFMRDETHSSFCRKLDVPLGLMCSLHTYPVYVCFSFSDLLMASPLLRPRACIFWDRANVTTTTPTATTPDNRQPPHQHESPATPRVLQAVVRLAPRGLDVAAVDRAVVGAPQRPSFLLAGVAVDGLPVAAGLRAVAVQDVHHARRTVLAAEPGGAGKGCCFAPPAPRAWREKTKISKAQQSVS